MDGQDYGLPDPVTDFNTRAATYHRFMLGVKWTLVTLAAVLVTLTLMFAANAGFIGSVVVGALIFAAGAYAMRHGLAHSSEAEMGVPPRH
jgi:ABC-type polysaccharide/polyol phosphate export permease